MRRADIIKLLSILGAHSISDTGEWINASCPMASISHSKGVDRHPSFGIIINNRGESVCRCFTCLDPMPLSGLIHNLWINKIPRWKEAMCFFGEKELFNSLSTVKQDLDIWKQIKSNEIKEPVPNRILARFPVLEFSFDSESERCRSFLREERGINAETQSIFSLRYDPNDNVIVFPRIDKENTVWWMSARSRLSKCFFGISPSHMKEPIEKWGDSSRFFGEHLLTKDPLILVESETDVLRLHSLGINNAIASCGGIRETQLASLFHSITMLGFDNDVPGLKNRIKAEKLLRTYTTLFYLDWGIAGVNDAGALKSKADFDKVYNAKKLL